MLFKTPIKSSYKSQVFGVVFGDLIKSGRFEQIFHYIPSNGYELDKLGIKNLSPGKETYMHPIIFDYFLNYYGYAFILELKDIHYLIQIQTPQEIAWRRNDLLEILVEFFSNLDSTKESKVVLKSFFLALKEDFLYISIINGNVKLSKFFFELPNKSLFY